VFEAIIVMVLVIAGLITAVVLLIKSNIKVKGKNKLLQVRIDSIKDNLTQVIDYTEINNDIQKKQDIIKTNMKDKTDEEKTDIINNIVDIFNDSEL